MRFALKLCLYSSVTSQGIILSPKNKKCELFFLHLIINYTLSQTFKQIDLFFAVKCDIIFKINVCWGHYL